MSQSEGLVLAARPLQLAACLVAPPIRPADGLPLRPRADDPTVTVSVPNEPLQEQEAGQTVRTFKVKSPQVMWKK